MARYSEDLMCPLKGKSLDNLCDFWYWRKKISSYIKEAHCTDFGLTGIMQIELQHFKHSCEQSEQWPHFSATL